MCIGNSFHRPRKRTCHHGGRFNFGRRILEQHYFLFDAFKQNRQKMDDHRYPSTFAHCNILILTTRCHQKEDETMSRHITCPTQRFSLSSGFIIARCTLRTDKGGVTRNNYAVLDSIFKINTEFLVCCRMVPDM